MTFLKLIKLLLPALFPSWNFFDVITPSPRIQFSLLKTKIDSNQSWQEFRPRPLQLSFLEMLKRMLWNPLWNESLFLVSCSERIVTDSSQQDIQYSENEILKRIKNELLQKGNDSSLLDITHLQFRLVFIQRKGNKLHEEIIFISRAEKLSADITK